MTIRKSARRGGSKHISTQKCQLLRGSGLVFEAWMSTTTTTPTTTPTATATATATATTPTATATGIAYFDSSTPGFLFYLESPRGTWGCLGCLSRNSSSSTRKKQLVGAAPAAATATATATAPAAAAAAATGATLWRGTFVGPPPTGHVLRFIDSGVFVLPVGGPSRSLLEVRGAAWVALPAGGFGSNSRQHKLWKNARKKDEQQHQQQQQQQ